MSDILERTPPPADHRLHYGAGEFHFGDFWLPKLAAGQRAPLVVFLHGGWWKAAYGLEYAGHLCADLRKQGIATWSLEYRRVGNEGGGYPGTFQDVAAGFDHVVTLAKAYPVDLSRVVTMGHSAGGHLAFWLAGRTHIPEGNALHQRPACAIKGVIALAGAVDLRSTIDLAGYFTFAHDKQEVINFMGGSPADVPDRYRVGNPGELLPLNVPQYLLQGTKDDQIPAALPARWAERGTRAGEKIFVEMIAGADHLDVVDPLSPAWPKVVATVKRALG